ncbi:MAG: hypothetical protein JNM93_05385 [Bacteriovoracaceae bacterium]|nr:hypothetical protein [Bacteriovoracaceae bacterium]
MKILWVIILLSVTSNSYAQKIKNKHKKEIIAAVEDVFHTIDQSEMSHESNRRDAHFTEFPGVAENVKSVFIEQYFKRKATDKDEYTVIKIGDYLISEKKNKFENTRHTYTFNDCKLSFRVKNGYIRDFLFRSESVDTIDVLACFRELVEGVDDKDIFLPVSTQFHFSIGHNENRKSGKNIDSLLSHSNRNLNTKEI